MNTHSRIHRWFESSLLALALAACGGPSIQAPLLPSAITQVMTKPVHQGATWSLRVVDVASGQLIYDLKSTAWAGRMSSATSRSSPGRGRS